MPLRALTFLTEIRNIQKKKKKMDVILVLKQRKMVQTLYLWSCLIEGLGIIGSCLTG